MTAKASTKVSAPSAQEAEAQLATFVDKFSVPHQKLIRAVRKALRARFATATEMVYDNYNFFVIGYGPTARTSEAVISLVAGSNGVGICFIQGKKLPDPKKILVGEGNQVRSIHLDSARDLERPDVEALFKAAIAASNVPFPEKGRGPLIIKSISAKQRPRQKTTA